jgi:hypothetical protein
LNNHYLENFRSKILAASILNFIGGILIHIAAATTAILFFSRVSQGYSNPYSPLYFFLTLFYIDNTIIFAVGFIIMIVGGFIEKKGWENFEIFLSQNRKSFPKSIYYEVSESIDNLKSGALLWALGFLIIPIFIGWISKIVGFFKLGCFRDWKAGMPKEFADSDPLVKTSIPPPTQIQTILPTPVQQHYIQQPASNTKFCPNCGAKVEGTGKFCGECGSELS